jgi:hypothetical protein
VNWPATATTSAYDSSDRPDNRQQHVDVPLRRVRAGELREEFLYELKTGPAGGRLRRPSSGRPTLSGQTARSVDGRAEPLGQLAEQIRLVFADPRHVAVRPQQHRGLIQFLADIDDVVDPIRPARHREPAGLVEQ